LERRLTNIQLNTIVLKGLVTNYKQNVVWWKKNIFVVSSMVHFNSLYKTETDLQHFKQYLTNSMLFIKYINVRYLFWEVFSPTYLNSKRVYCSLLRVYVTSRQMFLISEPV
jgi:hypothetical protein